VAQNKNSSEAGTLEVGHKVRDDAIWVTLSGELDLATAPTLQAALQEAESGDAAHPIVLDLRRLAFIDSSGLRVVLAAAKRAGDQGRRFVLVRGSDQVDRVFQVTGSDRHLEVVDEPPSFEPA
jgi:anti-sigma B factor antagonist